jgi:NifB/MoaA-like Fe-S oxidoreductase
MLGITKLKAGILLLVAFFNQGKEAAEDGVQTMDLFSFIDEAAQIPGVIASKDEILAELNDLDHSEKQEILDAVAEKLNVENEKAEKIVIAAIDALYGNYALVKAIAA